jgi:cell division protein FtsB
VLRRLGARLLVPGAPLVAVLLTLLSGCGRVPEQALRDEEARSRRYRDAYESLQGEVASLKAKVEKLEQGCPAPEGKQ